MAITYGGSVEAYGGDTNVGYLEYATVEPRQLASRPTPGSPPCRNPRSASA